MAVLLPLHLLAAVIWVGGMFFAYFVLRPASGTMSLAERLPLWSRALGRFFLFVWVAVVTLLVTGNWMMLVYMGGFEAAPVYVHVMNLLGWVMFLLFGHLFFAPWRRLRMALEAGTLDEAARYMNQIRVFVGINLFLGLTVVVIASGGRYGLL